MMKTDKPAAIHVDHLTVQYGQTPGIQGVCLDIPQGEYLGIIGPNGGGKTTLLKAILGLVPATEGKVEILGKPIQEGRKFVGYVPQFTTLNKHFPITVEEVVLTGRIRKGIAPFFRYSAEDRNIARLMMNRVNIDGLAKRQASQLSGGEFQKMLIARALATQPKILILDEPTASVDVTSRQQIFTLLAELNKEMTIILVTHDLLSVASHAGALACLSHTVQYYGEPTLSPEVTGQIFGCAITVHGDVAACSLHERNEAEKKQ
ncbi:MAG: ABC transporter ATP-binding protein [Eubacteriales bacterium]|nr:ABC transporter ATP-binding protein [Eubacteriales bacterium]